MVSDEVALMSQPSVTIVEYLFTSVWVRPGASRTWRVEDESFVAGCSRPSAYGDYFPDIPYHRDAEFGNYNSLRPTFRPHHLSNNRKVFAHSSILQGRYGF